MSLLNVEPLPTTFPAHFAVGQHMMFILPPIIHPPRLIVMLIRVPALSAAP
jgi:hypothetical protein